MNERAPFEYWTYFANEAQRADAPLYVRLAEGVRADPVLREFASYARPGQPQANILFGAVHYLLLRGADHPLRRFYPDLNGGSRIAGENPFPHFQDFVSRFRGPLASLVASRVTNTNEAGRSALLHPGFREVAKHAGESLNLIELGPSAGLNLIWDKYAVRYRHGNDTVFTEPRELPLTIECEVRGDNRPPVGPTPRVASRVGLERNPVDLSKPEERDWLKALVWPDHVARFARLEEALAICDREKPKIRAGDALSLLPEAIAALPEGQPVCIYHTMVIYQFSAAMRQAFNNLLLAVSLRRPLWRLGLEDNLKGDSPLTLGHYRDGRREVRTLAFCHPHGRWVDWRPDAAGCEAVLPNK